MQVNENEIEYKKKVGKLDGCPVYEIGLRGGLHLILSVRGGRSEVLGAGPHKAVARFVSKKKTENKIEFTDLSKSDHIEPEHFQDILPYYEALTDAFRARQGL